jgi:hypothetical protein
LSRVGRAPEDERRDEVYDDEVRIMNCNDSSSAEAKIVAASI